MPELPLTWLDVFTDVPLAGNALAVVHDADGLDDDTMLRFARETRLSETSFLQSPSAAGADYRNRIWTMAGEIDFAGHPSLGAAVAVARARRVGAVSLTQETRPGFQPIDVALEGDLARVSMLQEPAKFGPEIDPERAFGSVGLSASMAVPGFPAQIVGTGVPQLIVPTTPEALRDADPQGDVVKALLTEHGCVVIYLVAWDRDAEHAHARSYMVSPDGVAEDPATGSAVGPLCAYLEQRAGATRVVVDQGIEMGRPSVLEAEMEGDRVRVSGNAVVVADGTVRL